MVVGVPVVVRMSAVVLSFLSFLSFCRSVFLSFLSFCPSLSSVPSVRRRNLGRGEILRGSGGKYFVDRSDMASLFVRCNAMQARECNEQCQVGVSCQCQLSASDWIG